MIKNKLNTEHYFWGDKCEGFHLVKSDSLSVIQEIMPPDSSEQLHFHNRAEQFFYILNGTAVFEIEGKKTKLEKGCGISILPKLKHIIKNCGDDDLEFLVISQPTTKNDRINI